MAINHSAVVAAVTKRAVEMVEEKIAETTTTEANAYDMFTWGAGTRQDFKIAQEAVSRARQRERWAQERAANALLRTANGR